MPLAYEVAVRGGPGRISAQDLWHQKTTVPGVSYGIVCLILRVAISLEHRLVTDRDAGP